MAVGKRILATGLGVLPLELLFRVSGHTLLIPYYHIVSDRRLPHIEHLYLQKTVKEFRADLEWFLRHYVPIGLEDLIGSQRNGRALPKRSFLLTFDDGFREMSDIVAPILRRKGVNAAFFVNTAFIDNKELCYKNKASLIVAALEKERSPAIRRLVDSICRSAGVVCDDLESGILGIAYDQKAVMDQLANAVGLDCDRYLSQERPYMTAREISRLSSDGFGIGAHSIDHPLFAGLSLNEQVEQAIVSLRTLRQRFKLSYGAFAFPHSDEAVPVDFFERVLETGLLDVSFGTAGALDDSVACNYQRVGLESPKRTASRAVRFQLVRRIAKKVSGSIAIDRRRLSATSPPILSSSSF